MKSKPNLHRYISVFEKIGDQLVATVYLSDNEFDMIRTLMGCGDLQFMYDSYPLIGDILDELFRVLGERLPRGEYEYYLECDAD